MITLILVGIGIYFHLGWWILLLCFVGLVAELNTT